MMALLNPHESFDLLAVEMVVYTLSFIDADSLLHCRLVCKRWRDLIDSCVFQEKAARENELVNNGRGYQSFSEINSKNVRKLELPWYVFRVICKYDPFNTNLVNNHSGQNLNIMHSSYFETTDLICKKKKIVFKNYGLNNMLMKTLRPEISVMTWTHYQFSSNYQLYASVHDKNNQQLDESYISGVTPSDDNNWIKAAHSFKNQSNASYLIIHQYAMYTPSLNLFCQIGIKISGFEVKVVLPIKFKHDIESSIHI